MSSNFFRLVFWLTGWASALGMTLSLANWTGDWGHGVCGPWGCGPTIQSLLACHLSWFVILLPIAVLGRRWLPPRQTRTLAWYALTCSVISIASIAAYERFTWFAQASPMIRPYFWNRIEFAIITQVDLPMLQVLAISLTSVFTSQSFYRKEATVPIGLE